MEKVILSSASCDETKSLGKQLGAMLKEGDIVALIGELGSGKTCFAQGIALGLDVSPENYVRSPSFVIMNIYKGRIPMYHIDLYRLHEREEVIDLGIDEYLYGDGVSVVEWADRTSDLIKDAFLKIEFYYEDENRRRLELTGEGERGKELLWAL